MMKTKHLLLPGLLFLILLFGPAPCPVHAQDSTPAGDQAQAPGSEEAIQAKIEELQQRIKTFSEAETEEVAQALNVSLEQLRERTEVLRETQTFYAQTIQARHKQEALLQDKKSLEEKITTGEALKLEEEPPYSLKYYDDHNARYADSKRDLDTAQLGVAVAENSMRDARDRLSAAEAQGRALRDAEGQGKNQQEKLQNQWLFQQGEREQELAAAVFGFQEQVLANARIEEELAAIRVGLARQISETIRNNLHFDQSDLDEQLAVIDESRKELQAKAEAIRKNLRRASREVLKARRKVERAEGEKDVNAAKVELGVAEQWEQAYRFKLEQHESILQQMNTRKQLWKQRYDLVKGEIKREQLAGLKEEAVKLADRLQQTITLEQERQTSLQLQIGKLEESLQQEGLGWDAKGNLNEQRRAQVELVASTIDYLTALNKTSQMNLQFIEELDRVQRVFSLEETLKVVFAKLQGWWNMELMVVDNQALTVRKTSIALGILIFGIIIAGLFSRILHRRLLGSFRLSTSAAAIISKLVHYATVLVVVFFTMGFVNIPLTAFTFMGGAIALGVGFGAQKLINNFISGFILMVEQPVKVGDLIMMDKEPGWIEDIGVRSTRVRTYANINILVPNSYFLENNIINWTHNDNVVRGMVAVGVAYGSPTREVKDALLQAAAEHGEVRDDPEPYVWFSDFGDNALIFELYFWVTVNEQVGIQRVSSDLRFMIDHLFRESGITIAFPQRDVHFDHQNPLRVEIARKNTES